MFDNVDIDTCWAEVLDGYYYPLDPEKSDFSINTVATALSRQTRFGGHTGGYSLYSVAEHSIIVSDFVSNENAYNALMHDSTEAYLEDIKKPIKKILTEYNKLEDMCHRALAEYFCFDFPFPEEIHKMDVIVGYNEARLFGRNVDVWGLPEELCVDDKDIKKAIKGIGSVEARRRFLDRFKILCKENTGYDPETFMKPGSLKGEMSYA